MAALIRPDLLAYLEKDVLPRYAENDAAHGPEHVRRVIDNCLAIGREYPVSQELLYTAAAYHDLGIPQGRETHHLTSGRILWEDERLKTWFTAEERILMREAVEDHRASSKTPPRSLLGRILSEADRDLDPRRIVERTWKWGCEKFPYMTHEEQIARMAGHLREKYGEDGYLKLWLDTEQNRKGLSELRALLADPERLQALVAEIENEKTASE